MGYLAQLLLFVFAFWYFGGSTSRHNLIPSYHQNMGSRSFNNICNDADISKIQIVLNLKVASLRKQMPTAHIESMYALGSGLAGLTQADCTKTGFTFHCDNTSPDIVFTSFQNQLWVHIHGGHADRILDLGAISFDQVAQLTDYLSFAKFAEEAKPDHVYLIHLDDEDDGGTWVKLKILEMMPGEYIIYQWADCPSAPDSQE